MKRYGFTIVELIIIITIMGILITLGVVNLNGSQANARDAKRKTDIETIAIHLETFYTSGTDGSISVGRYPSTDELFGTDSNIRIPIVLRDIDLASVKAPGISNISLFAATNNLQTANNVIPSPTIDRYIYQPLQSDGTLCLNATQDCRKFNLYTLLENGDQLMVTSKNQ